MDNINQIERLHYAKICGERTLFYDFNINNSPLKSENLKHKSHRASFSTSVFFSEAAPKNYTRNCKIS